MVEEDYIRKMQVNKTTRWQVPDALNSFSSWRGYVPVDDYGVPVRVKLTPPERDGKISLSRILQVAWVNMSTEQKGFLGGTVLGIGAGITYLVYKALKK